MVWITRAVVFLICLVGCVFGANTTTPTMNTTMASTSSNDATTMIGTTSGIQATATQAMTGSTSIATDATSTNTNTAAPTTNYSMPNSSMASTQSPNMTSTKSGGGITFLVPSILSLMLMAFSSMVFYLV